MPLVQCGHMVQKILLIFPSFYFPSLSHSVCLCLYLRYVFRTPGRSVQLAKHGCRQYLQSWTRIRIHLVVWFRIQEGKNDLQTKAEIEVLKGLDVLLGGHTRNIYKILLK
jgi:hypothetical protein